MARIVIIGGVAAGAKAAMTARRRNPGLEIVVIQEDAELAYSACGIPYHLAQPETIPRARLIARTADELAREGIVVRARVRAEAIELGARAVFVRDLEHGRTGVEPFDRLLLATGAAPIAPPYWIDAAGPPVVTLRRLADIDRCRPPDTGSVVVVGGGPIGVEAAEAYRSLGCRVTLVERLPRLFASLPDSIGDAVQAELERHGIRIITDSSVARTVRTGVELESGETIPASLVLQAAGIRPRTELAEAAGIRIGTTGAIAVDRRQRTSAVGVYAAGDCAESRHRLTDRPVWLPLGDVANRQGRVAGENLAGGDAEFPGVLGTMIVSVFGLAMARTGLTAIEADRAGFEPIGVEVTAPSRARYMPGAEPIRLCLVADRPSRRVLGAAAVGRDGIGRTIDILATAIWAGLTVDDVAELDLAYAPPYSPVFAVPQVAAELLRPKPRLAPSGG
jgi:NADPH-dependent 2,4-dienoyl-CoA reductase/sulfur reductase-like enzyme